MHEKTQKLKRKRMKKKLNKIYVNFFFHNFQTKKKQKYVHLTHVKNVSKNYKYKCIFYQ